MEKTSYEHGAPSFVDIATPDIPAAQAFYTALFGWEFTESDPEAGGYCMALLGDKTVAGMMPLSDEMAAGGMPPCWTTYVTVDDIEAAAGRIGDSGGTVLQPPMDVMTAGRMAIFSSPSGAVSALWEPKDHIGSQLVNEPNTLCWNELLSTDLGTDTAFFASVLGWQAVVSDEMPDYTALSLDGSEDKIIGGAMAPPMPGMPSVWLVYFAVDDTDATVAKAAQLGATPMGPAMDIPVGRIATMADPTGAVFAIIQMNEPA